MHEQQIISSVCLSRGSQITTVLALYDVKTNSILYYTFKDDFLHQNLSALLLNEKITTLVVQKELIALTDLFKNEVNLVCVDRKTFNINPRVSSDDYFTDSTISSLLYYLNLNDYTMKDLKLVRKHLPDTMYIPKNVISDLEILDKKTFLLINLVNFTKTRYGSIKLKNNIIQPFTDIEKIKRRHCNILHFIENESLVMKLDNILKDTPYIINILSDNFNIERKTLESLKKALEDSKKVNKFIDKCYELTSLLHTDLILFDNSQETFTKSKISEIKTNFEEVFNSNGESSVKEGLDDYLDLARKIYNELFDDASKIAENHLDDKKFKIIKTSKGIYLKAHNRHLMKQPDMLQTNKEFPIDQMSTFQDENLTEFLDSSYMPSICSISIQDSKIDETKEFILLAKNKSHFLVVTKEIYRLNVLIGGIYDQIIELEGEIALNLLRDVSKRLPTLIPLCEHIAELDVCLSGYKFASSYNCCLPQFEDFISISESFYPPLKSSVHNDYYVDKNNLLNIITGPNMSGKSTYLKQLSYLIILAQIGYPLTAKFAITKIFTGLYVSFNSTRIDLHCMQELLEHYTSTSLIIIDEPGKGYDVDIPTAFYSVLFKQLMISKPVIFFIIHHYDILKLNMSESQNFLQVEKFRV